MSQRVPLPQSLWLRIVAFLIPGNDGRIEFDVSNGRVVSCRIVETNKVREDEFVQLKESASRKLLAATCRSFDRVYLAEITSYVFADRFTRVK